MLGLNRLHRVLKGPLAKAGSWLAMLLFPLFIIDCMDAVSVPQSAGQPALIHNLTAVIEGQRVRLSWDAPAVVPTFFRIYRTAVADSGGKPDTTTWFSYDKQTAIDASARFFLDVPGAGHGQYFYTIQGINVLTNNNGITDTIKGPLSKVSSCLLGNAIRFYLFDPTIESEDNANVIDVQATLLDPRLELDSVRFTNSELIDTGTGLFENIFQQTQPHSIDECNQLASLKRFGWPRVSRSSSIIARVPLFKSSPIKVGIAPINRYPFRLSEGFGKKFVFAEIRYKNGLVDTVVDFIQTVPRKVSLELRNSQETMLDTTVGTERRAIIYGKELFFGIKNFAGDFIDTSFEAWIVFSNNTSSVVDPFNDQEGNANWYMTKPVRFSLTGKGNLHKSDTVYSFPLTLEKDTRYGVFDNLLKGSYTKPLENLHANGSSEIRRLHQEKFDSLVATQLSKNGVKNFLFVTRFRDSQFNDEFIRIMGYSENADTFDLSRDIYLPRVIRQINKNQNPYNIVERKDVISDVFSYALNNDSSLTDGGGFAPTVAVSLVMALKPEAMEWNDTIRQSLTLRELKQLPHKVKEFPLSQFGHVIPNVKFENIDPRLWTSGQYIFAVIVRDAYGNEGIAPIFQQTVDLNPFLVTIKTSY